jgi:cofilin
MASGVKVLDKCKIEFNNIKMKHQYRYILFKLTDDLTAIEVEKTGTLDSQWEEFVDDLKKAVDKGQPRYAVYDFAYDTPEGPRTKLCFIYFATEECNIKQKMVYSASKSSLVNELQPGIKNIQVNDFGDLEIDNVLEKIK